MALKKWIFLPMLIAAFLLTGCRATRNLGMDAQLRKQQNERIQLLIQQPKELTDLTAKTAITINYEEKSLNVKGRLRMRRDEVVQMSITALGVVEVALIEFTPESAYLIDRVNKRYAKIDYTSGMLNTIGLNFETVQALFWNRLFIPGKGEAKIKPDNFAVTLLGSPVCIEPVKQFLLKCKFYTDAECKQLQQTQIGINDYEVIWQYDMFKHIATTEYPTVFDVSVSADSHSLGAHIVLNNVSYVDNTWTAGTNLARYTKVELEDLLSILKLLI